MDTADDRTIHEQKDIKVSLHQKDIENTNRYVINLTF